MSTTERLTKLPVLETERLILRKLSLEDVKDIFEYASIPEVSEFLPWDRHKTIDDTIAFLKIVEEQFAELKFIVLGIELKTENKLIGTIALRNWDKSDRCIDIGYVISNKYWNRGLATEAVKEIIKFGFEELSGNRIEAHCDEDNKASYRVMEKSGMKFEGTLRQKVLLKNKFTSMKFYSILREEFYK
jgi:ribosomal-protein-alanine N-acetyltransferase